MALKNLYLFFGSLSCASMSRVSKLVNTILNGLLSPLKTPNYALFKKLFQTLASILQAQKIDFFFFQGVHFFEFC